MRRIISILLLILPLTVFSQRSNEIQIRAGGGIGIYKTESKLSYSFGGVSVSADTTDGAATAHVPIELRYEVSSRFNLGIDMKFGKYLQDEADKNAGNSNKFTIIGLGFEGTLLSNEDSRVFIGAGFNSGSLEMRDESTSGTTTYTEVAKWKGGGFRVNVGTLFFIANGPIGFNLNLGYDQHTFKLDSFTRDGDTQDISNIEGTLKVGGVELNAGLVFRIMP